MLEKFRSSGVNTGRIEVNETLKQAEFYQKKTKHRLFPMVPGQAGYKGVPVYCVPFSYYTYLTSEKFQWFVLCTRGGGGGRYSL